MSRFATWLDGIDVSDIEADLAALRTERVRVEQDIELAEKALEVKRARMATQDGDGPVEVDHAPEIIRRRPPTVGLSDAVLGFIDADRDRTWDTDEIVEGLEGQFQKTSVLSALSRLQGDNLIQRVARGRYRSRHGAIPDPVPDTGLQLEAGGATP
jgi:hypothetical protein